MERRICRIGKKNSERGRGIVLAVRGEKKGRECACFYFFLSRGKEKREKRARLAVGVFNVNAGVLPPGYVVLFRVCVVREDRKVCLFVRGGVLFKGFQRKGDRRMRVFLFWCLKVCWCFVFL